MLIEHKGDSVMWPTKIGSAPLIDPRLPNGKPPYVERDPRTYELLQHKGSPVPLEPARDDWRQGDRAASSMPWPARPEFIRHVSKTTSHSEPRHDLDIKALKPLYTTKLPASPRFPSLAQATQRRRDRWTKIIARGSLGLMVLAGAAALWYGSGIFPAGAAAVGLITFIATCAYAASRNRNRVS